MKLRNTKRTAEYVLRQYSKGYRDFTGIDLKNVNLSGTDLSGVNLSSCDIRGAKFSRTILKEAKLCGVEAGVPRKIGIFLSILSCLIACAACAAASIAGFLLLSLLEPDLAFINSIFIFLSIWLISTSALIAITWFSQRFSESRFFEFKATLANLIAILMATLGLALGAFGCMRFAVSGHLGYYITPHVGNIFDQSFKYVLSIFVLIAIGQAMATGLSIIGAFSYLASKFIPYQMSIIFGFLGAGIGLLTISGQHILISGLILVSPSILIGWYTCRGAVGCKPTWASTKGAGTLIACFFGTDFRGADLTKVNFSGSILESTDFTQSGNMDTKLTEIYCKGVKGLGFAKTRNSIFADPKVQELVVKCDCSGKKNNFDGSDLTGVNLQGANLQDASFIGANLSQSNLRGVDLSRAILKQAQLDGVNLQGANLQDASFIGANLNQSNLRGVDLSRAILKQAQLDGSDLTGATLTAAYIEDWGITNTIKLNDVKCEYVYMRLPTKENPNPLRKPDNERENFKSGEFANFIRPYFDTLDLYHRQDIDPRTISIALKDLVENHPEAQLQFVAIEWRGNGLNIRYTTAPDADKSELSHEYCINYARIRKELLGTIQLKLAAQDAEISRMEGVIKEFIQTKSSQSTTIQVETINLLQGESVMIEDKSIQVNANNNAKVSGLSSGDGVVNLGIISGNVTNAINQLPEDPELDQPDLKELLIQLQHVIQNDPNLLDPDKSDLLEQVQALAEAKQVEEPAKREGLIRKAMKMFDATLKSLPDTAKIVEACSKLLPLILKALSIST
jgi:uncharacterized protein YjbI with pentapeptide repeats